MGYNAPHQRRFQKRRPERYSYNYDAYNFSKVIRRNKIAYDSFKNAASGFGGQYDPINRLSYNISSTLSKGDIETLYRYDWISRKIIETIPDDAIRKWIDIHMPDEVLVRDVQEKIKSLKGTTKIKQAMINARLYGGAVIIPGIFDGNPPIEPLDMNSIEDVLHLNVLDKHSLNVVQYYKNPFEPNYGEPELYRLDTRLKPDNYDPQDYIIHETRLFRFDGAYLPEFTKHINKGWDDPILVGINKTLKQYGTSIQSGAILFQDFISKVLKLPNLSELLMTEEGRATLKLRMQYAISTFSSIGMVLIGEGEEYNKTQTPISGLPELMDKYIQVVSAASNIPRARLFGQSLGTLAGATETTRAYYDFVVAYQTDHLQEQLNRFISILLSRKSGINRGEVPKEWSFKFNSLWDATDKEVTTARKMQAQVDDLYIKNKTLTPEEVARSRFRSDGYSFDTIVDINNRLGEFYQEPAGLLPPPQNSNQGEEENKNKNKLKENE